MPALPCSPEAGLYWDPTSGNFYSSTTGLWYRFDSVTQQFVELSAAAP